MAKKHSSRAFQLVHANVAITRAPLEDPVMEGFVSRVDHINAIAQTSPGFVAQPVLPDEGQVYTGTALLNVSLWKTVEDLERFTHSGEHALALDRRSDWFEQRVEPNYVLYWVLAGHIPTEAEVRRRLKYLTKHGPTPYAFSFKQPFTVDEMLAFVPDEVDESAHCK